MLKPCLQDSSLWEEVAALKFPSMKPDMAMLSRETRVAMMSCQTLSQLCRLVPNLIVFKKVLNWNEYYMQKR